MLHHIGIAHGLRPYRSANTASLAICDKEILAGTGHYRRFEPRSHAECLQ